MRETGLPADAGASLAEVVAGPRRAARVLAAFPTAVYLAPDGGRVLAIEAADGVGLPNGLRLRRPADGLDLGHVDVEAPATVGAGEVRTDGLVASVDRWVEHTYRPAGVDTTVLARRLEAFDELVRQRGEPLTGPLAGRVDALAAAVTRDEPEALCTAGRALVGLGGGLTPSGDDVLCGLVSAGRTLARARGADDLDVALHRLGGTLLADAAERTTALSAALLWHAARGELARPARGVLRALLGRTPLEPAVDALLAVGHSSGRDLAVGMGLGARAVLAATGSDHAGSSRGPSERCDPPMRAQR
jgi:hypothetical protein